MAFATTDLLAAIVAPFGAALLGRLHRLAVDRRYPWLVVAARFDTDIRAEQVNDFIPGAAVDPGTVVVVARSPARKLVRQHAPLAAGPHHIKKGIEQIGRASCRERG